MESSLRVARKFIAYTNEQQDALRILKQNHVNLNDPTIKELLNALESDQHSAEALLKDSKTAGAIPENIQKLINKSGLKGVALSALITLSLGAGLAHGAEPLNKVQPSQTVVQDKTPVYKGPVYNGPKVKLPWGLLLKVSAATPEMLAALGVQGFKDAMKDDIIETIKSNPALAKYLQTAVKANPDKWDSICQPILVGAVYSSLNNLGDLQEKFNGFKQDVALSPEKLTTTIESAVVSNFKSGDKRQDLKKILEKDKDLKDKLI